MEKVQGAEKTIWEDVQEAAISGTISVPAMTSVINDHHGTQYTARRNKEGQRQTPLYQAILRGNIHAAEPPPHMRGKWIVVDKALEDYLKAFRPR